MQELKTGDFILINFIRGTQIAYFIRKVGAKGVMVNRWLDSAKFSDGSRGQFGGDVRISATDVVGLAPESDPRLTRARAALKKSQLQDGPWK